MCLQSNSRTQTHHQQLQLHTRIPLSPVTCLPPGRRETIVWTRLQEHPSWPTVVLHQSMNGSVLCIKNYPWFKPSLATSHCLVTFLLHSLLHSQSSHTVTAVGHVTPLYLLCLPITLSQVGVPPLLHHWGKTKMVTVSSPISAGQVLRPQALSGSHQGCIIDGFGLYGIQIGTNWNIHMLYSMVHKAYKLFSVFVKIQLSSSIIIPLSVFPHPIVNLGLRLAVGYEVSPTQPP